MTYFNKSTKEFYSGGQLRTDNGLIVHPTEDTLHKCGFATYPPPPVPEPHAPTREEIEAARAAAYRATVDPITCEIARLRDMGGSAAEIAEAEARREAAVAAIKEQWPYTEGAE